MGASMLTRSIIIVCVFVASAFAAQAQLSGTRLRLVDNAQTFGCVLIPPTPSLADIEYRLPSTGGTLLVDDGTGKSGWLVGGQNVPSTALIGSTTAFDVQLVAGPLTTPRANVLAATKAVELPDATELRFYEPAAGGTNYTSFVAGNQAGNITLILPATVGPVGAVLGIAAAPAPTPTSATTTWVEP